MPPKCHDLDDRPTATESNKLKENVCSEGLEAVYKASVSTINYYIYFA